MKFLAKLAEEYNKLEVEKPQWVKEYVTPTTPSSTVATTPSTSITGTKPGSNLGKAIQDTLDVQIDPELAKKKEELDNVYKQVADALKKKAMDATNKLKQTSSELAATPTTAVPSVPAV